MRICSGAGCGRAVADTVRFCAECEADQHTSTSSEREHKAVNPLRAGTTAFPALYNGSRWKSIRKTIMSRDTVCAICKANLSRDVDHIVPAVIAIEQAKASKRWPLDPVAGFFLVCNLQGLCRSCHEKKGNEDAAHQGEWPSVLDMDDAAPKRTFSF